MSVQNYEHLVAWEQCEIDHDVESCGSRITGLGRGCDPIHKVTVYFLSHLYRSKFTLNCDCMCSYNQWCVADWTKEASCCRCSFPLFTVCYGLHWWGRSPYWSQVASYEGIFVIWGSSIFLSWLTFVISPIFVHWSYFFFSFWRTAPWADKCFVLVSFHLIFCLTFAGASAL